MLKKCEECNKEFENKTTSRSKISNVCNECWKVKAKLKEEELTKKKKTRKEKKPPFLAQTHHQSQYQPQFHLSIEVILALAQNA